jgi:hypothetical protein
LNKEFFKKKLFLLKHSESLLHKRSEIQKHLYDLLTAHSSQEEITLVRRELLELDHSLDILTDDNQIDKEHIIKEITEQLVMLGCSFPEKLNIEINRQAHQELHAIAPYVLKYYHHLKKSSSLLQKGKKRSLVSILFGRHPKVLLSYEITTIAKEASRDLSIINEFNFVHTSHGVSICKELLDMLKEILYESNKRWNHSLYEEAFLLFFTKISKLKEKLDISIEENTKSYVSLQEKTIEQLDLNLNDVFIKN